jgi:hypothetical protein
MKTRYFILEQLQARELLSADLRFHNGHRSAQPQNEGLLDRSSFVGSHSSYRPSPDSQYSPDGRNLRPDFGRNDHSRLDFAPEFQVGLSQVASARVVPSYPARSVTNYSTGGLGLSNRSVDNTVAPEGEASLGRSSQIVILNSPASSELSLFILKNFPSFITIATGAQPFAESRSSTSIANRRSDELSASSTAVGLNASSGVPLLADATNNYDDAFSRDGIVKSFDTNTEVQGVPVAPLLFDFVPSSELKVSTKPELRNRVPEGMIELNAGALYSALFPNLSTSKTTSRQTMSTSANASRTADLVESVFSDALNSASAKTSLPIPADMVFLEIGQSSKGAAMDAGDFENDSSPLALLQTFLFAEPVQVQTASGEKPVRSSEAQSIVEKDAHASLSGSSMGFVAAASAVCFSLMPRRKRRDVVHSTASMRSHRRSAK